MITQQPLTAISLASNVLITEEEYKTSYINTWLNEVFLGSMNDTDKAKIQDNTFNIGIYTNVSEITTTKKAGLLDEEQYIKAGKQNSFLDIKDLFWLGNRYDAASVRSVYVNGTLSNYNPTDAFGVRPVIKISNLTFTEGEGTLDNPYREKSTTTNTTNIKVGEYISVSTSGTDCGEDKRCLFRVVSKDSDSVKVILNGLLPNVSAFGSTTAYTSGNTVDTVVTTFANTIDNQYRYTGNKSFNIGTKYTGTAENPVNVGLPVAGEMFSGNDIDVTTSSKTFVNVNTIENPAVSDFFWTMNAYSTSTERYVDSHGSRNLSSNYNPTNAYGVRVVMYLQSNLTFTAGEGTAENPFILE